MSLLFQTMMMSSGGSAPAAPEITPISIAIASDGVTLTVTYGEALDTAYQSDIVDWAVTVAGVLRTVDAVSVPGGATVVLTLASPVFVGQVTTLTYAQGANAVRSLADGHLAANFGPSAVDTSAAWDFGSVAGLILHADVDQWTDTAGALTSAPDASGEGNDLTVSGSVTRTASDVNFNGHASVTSAGGYLQRGAWVGGDLELPYTMYVVTKMPAQGPYLVTDVADGMYVRVVSSSIRWRAYGPGLTTSVDVEGGAVGEVGILRLVVKSGEVDGGWYPFGGPPTTVTGQPIGSVPMTGITLLARFSGINPYNGDMANILVWAADVDGDDDDAVMTRLTDLYS